MCIIHTSSVYEGNKWDGFRDQMDDDLLAHLNGNAVYNVTDPRLASLVDVVRKDVDDGQVHSSFDVRICEVLSGHRL